MPLKKKRVPRKVTKKKVVKKTALKRIIVKKKPAKKAAPRKPRQKGKPVGIITHYFPRVNVGVLKLKAPLAVGDTVKIKGHTTDFTQAIISMQLEYVVIANGKKGQEIGLLVDSRVRQHDAVYKL